MSKKIIIAIDGPSGSGKSTIAKYLADQLKATYIDTGAMYRAITYEAMQRGIVDNVSKIIEMLNEIELKLNYENGLTRVFVNEKEVTDNIRSAEVNSKVSEVSKIPEVRKKLIEIQRKLAKSSTVVAEGRDTTTVVFPNADFKIYLTADLDVRAERRLKEYKEKGVVITFDEVRDNLAKRDKIDSSRKVSPLRKAEDAFEMDSTSLTVDEELELLLNKIKDFIKTN